MMFGDGSPAGTLSVQIPKIIEDEDRSISYSDEILYERGFRWNAKDIMDNDSSQEELEGDA